METAEIAELIEELSPRIERLRALYEQYFMGLEKLEPATLRKEVDRTIWRLRKERINNTRTRFKLQQLIQRYNTYQQYWARVLREMENGTYRRDVLKAAKRVGSEAALTIVGRRRARMFRGLQEALEDREARAGAPSTPPSADGAPAAVAEAPGVWRVASDFTADASDTLIDNLLADALQSVTKAPATAGRTASPGRSGAAPTAPAAPAGRPPPPHARRTDEAPAAPAPTPNDVRERQIYDEYVRARRAANEPTAGITPERLASSLRKQTEKLRLKHGDKRVDYEVVTHNGRTLIRPVVR